MIYIIFLLLLSSTLSEAWKGAKERKPAKVALYLLVSAAMCAGVWLLETRVIGPARRDFWGCAPSS